MTDRPAPDTGDSPERPKFLPSLGKELTERRRRLVQRRRRARIGIAGMVAVALFGIALVWISRDEPSPLVTAGPRTESSDRAEGPDTTGPSAVDPSLLCTTYEPDPPPIAGPLSDDPDLRTDQQTRAEWGLPSDLASAEAAAADPVEPAILEDAEMQDLLTALGVPVTAEEVDLLRPAGITDPDDPLTEALSGYLDAQFDTFAYSRIVDRVEPIMEVAFSDRIDEHRAAIGELGISGVRVIQVEHSVPELIGLRDQLAPLIASDRNLQGAGAGNPVNRLVISLGTLDPDTTTRVLDTLGADAPVCFEGADPAETFPAGPQPEGGDGWRLLADQPGAGIGYQTAVATTTEALEGLWAELSLDGPPPDVPFGTEIVAWFGAVYSSSCPDIRLDDITIDLDQRTVTASVVLPGGNRACESDANPRAYVVALDRDALPPAPFEIRLGEADSPACCPDQNTTVTQALLDSESSVTEPGDTSAPEPSALGLVWSVVAVDDGDVLNVRDRPDPTASVIAELPPWSTGVAATDETDQNEHGTWRRIVLDDLRQGWVNARFLVAQPAVLDDDDREAMVDVTEGLVSWALDGSDNAQTWLADRALWVGGIGVYADIPTPWTWIPAEDLTRPSDWTRQRDFSEAFDQLYGFKCGTDCQRSLNRFLRIELLDETTRSLIDDVISTSGTAWPEGGMSQAPSTLHRVVLDKPNSDTPGRAPDWQRIHFVLDWSTGDPRIALIHIHGWTP